MDSSLDISMEYLTRVLEYATQTWFFRYHPMCGALRLNHLLFADDLLMFSKGDVKSIMLLLRAFATFSATSGLKVNAAKSEVVFSGVPTDVRSDILQISGFKEGALPFRYLGIPIQLGRLTKQDCNILVERIVARIRGMGARKLSYVGRLTLVNSVLNTLHNYWGSIFLIPITVVQKIVNVCRNYFWDGGTDYQKAPLVAWHKVCCCKSEGGLGVKNAENWNIATVGKLVDWIYKKADRLWVLWIDHVYLKGQDWHTYTPPSDSNWNWRNICKVRGLLSAGYMNNVWQDARGYSVGSGYAWLQGVHPPVQWHKEIWDAWSATESHEHLFEDCQYVLRIIEQLEQWLHLSMTGQNALLSKLQQKVAGMAKLACWYTIWLERNRGRLEHRITRPEILVQDIQRLVKARVQMLLKGPVMIADQHWLKKKLGDRAQYIHCPWIIVGDFNTVLAPSERLGGQSTRDEMQDFQQFIDTCGVMDMPASGSYYTWNNKQDPDSRVYSRLDRAFVNKEWLDTYKDTYALFHAEGDLIIPLAPFRI
ncbi:uncharacterized protein LOC141639780 [Silene latifolia]|uniref:uncharacterized protein LOC141639780 n=1 Tax=Silene latifolia TaxID=37657 RepID=UPI003D77048D